MNPSSENFPRERLFELTFQSASIGMALVGLDGRWLRVNQALCRLVGYSETELLALTFQDITHPEDLDLDLTLLGQLLRDEIETYELEKRYLRKDGRVVWILLSVSLARDKHHKPSVFVSQIQDISGRKLAEKARETLFRLPVALHFVAGFDGYFKELSPSWADLLGYSNEVLRSAPYLDLVHPDDRQRTIEEAARINGGANTFFFENRYRHSDGSYRSLLWVSSTAIEDELVYGLALDSTARKDAEEALRLFRNLVDQSNDTIEVIDPESGRFLDVNANGPAELGYSREEYLSLRVVDIDPALSPSDWPQVAAQVRAAGSINMQGHHQRKDGSTFPVEINAKWVHLDRDYIVAVIRNISERKRGEAQLHESQRRFREMLENVDLLALMVDCEGRITFCNDYLLKLTGWSLEEALGADWFSKFIPCSPEVKELYIETIKEGKMPTHYENPIQTKSGELRDIVWNNTMLRDEAGKILGTAAIGTDVTQRKRTEEQIRLLNQDLESRVAARTAELRSVVNELEGASTERKRLEREILEISEREQCRLGQDLHDGLSQELAGIALLGKVLANTLQAEAHPSASVAAQIATYTSDTINSARQLAKGLYPVELSQFGLIVALEDLANQISHRFGVCCELHRDRFAPDLGHSAEIHIYRIVQECVGNAIKHGRARRIIIESLVDEGVHSVTVTDNGIGFERLASGSGMGLRIMDHRARVIGAQINVTKLTEGGCRVTCRLPI